MEREHTKSRSYMNTLAQTVSDTRRPGDGFYSYVNKKWLQKHHISSWQSEFGVSDEMEHATDKELLEILNSLTSLKNIHLTPKTARGHLQLLGHIWKNKSIQSDESYLQVCLHELIEFKNETDISRFFGWLVRSIPTIIDIGAREELVEPYAVRATLGIGSLILPNKYYLDKSLRTSDVWKAYEEFIGICSIELGLPYLLKGIDAEVKLAHIITKPFIHLSQNKSGNGLTRWVSEFEWTGFMEGLDIDSHWRKRTWAVDSSERVKDVLEWLCSADTEYIVGLLSLHLVRFSAPYLRTEIRDAHDKLFLQALNGVDKRPPESEVFLNNIKQILPDALCILYSENHKAPGVLEGISELASDLQAAAVEVMSASDIFTKRTRSKVIEKLHRMRFEIGKGVPAPLPAVTYTPDSLLHTILTINGARIREIPLVTGKGTDNLHSSYPCYVANASYFAESNKIVIPWGILQEPFYYKGAPLGWNHGGIGAVVCHEMTHGFDLEGSMYSPRGVYKEWWTRKNRNSFSKETRKVARFFSKFKHYGKAINGEKTLSENWADLGGLTISLHSLKTKLDTIQASKLQRMTAYRNFFISYAVSWRTLVRKKKMLFSMIQSVHAPSQDRVDRNVPQFQEWVDAFNVRETDNLYLDPKDRLKFF